MTDARIVRGTLPLRVEGVFKPWAIAVGHSRFLLRGLIGDPEDEAPPRAFDVVFHDVSRVCVSDRYPSLELRVAPADVRSAEERRLGVEWRETTMYLIGPGPATDYVVAGRVYWAEVDTPAGLPSPLLADDAVEGHPRMVYAA